jgi:hypothetical protein
VGDSTAAARSRLSDTVGDALIRESMATELGALAGAQPAQRTISATSEDCAQSIRPLAHAGANAVLLQPIPGTEREQLPLLAQVVSLLRAA